MKIQTLIVLGAFLHIATVASAQETLYFNNPAGGNWSDAGTWSTDLAGSDSVDWVSGSHAVFGVTAMDAIGTSFFLASDVAVASLSRNKAGGGDYIIKLSGVPGRTITNTTGALDVVGILSLDSGVTLGGSATVTKTGIGHFYFYNGSQYTADAFVIEGGRIVWSATVANWRALSPASTLEAARRLD